MTCKKIPFTPSAEKTILIELIELRHRLEAFGEKSAHFEMPCDVNDDLHRAVTHLLNAESCLSEIVSEQDNG